MDEIQQRTQLDEQIIRVTFHFNHFFTFIFVQHYFDSVRNHQWPNQSSYYCANSHEIYSVESNQNLICANSTNTLPIILDSRISISPQSIISFEQMSIINNQRGIHPFSLFRFYLFYSDERLTKEESSILIKENNKSMILLNYPRLFQSSTSSSPTELDNSRQYHSPSPSLQQTNPLYTDLTPVINSTPLPSFETLNS
jgi:hypothetical protein